ncbi:PREDICTED: monoacylglycerol lipase ABHD6 [Hipposideros armiger]|uniref:acylglycerol lipase n=1 Tax=Hipposideros armiger TaxID=186990 RepID=A0A8B7S4R7_HIPAR|nr:PREDICTED: monoacylglycerol lipase ABHD6 [Hipposideros armiger]
MDLDVVNMFVIAGGTLAIPILAFVASFLLWPSALIKIYYCFFQNLRQLWADTRSSQCKMGLGMKVDALPSCFGMNPTGLQYPRDTQFMQRLRELKDSAAVEKIPLIPSTPEEMSEMLQLCSYVRFKVPQQGPKNHRCQVSVGVCPPSAHRHLNLFHLVSSLVLQVLDVSGADVLAKSIANCQVELLENCGHSVVMERPRKAAKLIVDFLASVHNTDSKKLD